MSNEKNSKASEPPDDVVEAANIVKESPKKKKELKQKIKRKKERLKKIIENEKHCDQFITHLTSCSDKDKKSFSCLWNNKNLVYILATGTYGRIFTFSQRCKSSIQQAQAEAIASKEFSADETHELQKIREMGESFVFKLISLKDRNLAFLKRIFMEIKINQFLKKHYKDLKFSLFERTMKPKNRKEFDSICLIFQKKETTLRKFINKTRNEMTIKKIMEEKHYEFKVKDLLRSIVSQVCQLHKCGIIHLDLKPSNILVNHNSNEAYLIDFGLSTSQEIPCDCNEHIVASLWYRPIELFENSSPQSFFNSNRKPFPASKKIDSWSLGAILLEIVTTVPVFYGMKDKEVKQRIETFFSNNRLGLIQKKFQISEDFIDLIKKLLDRNIETRILPKEALDHPFFKEKTTKKRNQNSNMSFEKESFSKQFLCSPNDYQSIPSILDAIWLTS